MIKMWENMVVALFPHIPDDIHIAKIVIWIGTCSPPGMIQQGFLAQNNHGLLSLNKSVIICFYLCESVV
jgi:hypothetical protein